MRNWDGERHAVLTVSTDQGDYVLDNLDGEVLPWKQTDYVWVERQAANSPSKWVTMTPAPDGPKLAAAPTAPTIDFNAPLPAMPALQTVALLTKIDLPAIDIAPAP